MTSRTGAPRARLGLNMELLEDRTVPAYVSTPGATVAVGDVFGPTNGPFIVEGSTAGAGPVVTVFNMRGQQLGAFYAYDPSFRGGVNVAVGDLSGNGTDVIITSPGQGGGPNVKVFDANGDQELSFFAYSPTFTGGVSIAAGNLTGGKGGDEIVTGPGPGGGPNVRVFNASSKLISSMLPYDPLFRGGVNVAIGNPAGQTTNQIITGAGAGGSPLVQVFTPQGTRLSEFYAYSSNDRTGVSVASGNTDEIGNDQIWVSRGPGSDSTVQAYTLQGTLLSSFLAYGSGYTGGVNLVVADATGDGVPDVVTVQATGAYTQQPSIFPGQYGLVPQGPNYTLATGYYAQDDNFTYYFPAGFTNNKKYPIMFSFDPTGDTTNPAVGTYDAQLKAAADTEGFIIATSKYFRAPSVGPLPGGGQLSLSYGNGTITAGAGYYTQISMIQQVLKTFLNVDKTRVIFEGYGDGGAFAQALNFLDPAIADGLVLDNAPIWSPQTGYVDWHGYATTNTTLISSQLTAAANRRVAEFLVDPNDPSYSFVTGRDTPLYSTLGYASNTFSQNTSPAGTPAPAATYSAALAALFASPTWINPP